MTIDFYQSNIVNGVSTELLFNDFNTVFRIG